MSRVSFSVRIRRDSCSITRGYISRRCCNVENLIHVCLCVHGYYKHLLHHISTIEHRGVAKLLLSLLLYIIIVILLLLLLLSSSINTSLLSHLRLRAFINNILCLTQIHALLNISFSLCTICIYVHGIYIHTCILVYLYEHT